MQWHKNRLQSFAGDVGDRIEHEYKFFEFFEFRTKLEYPPTLSVTHYNYFCLCLGCRLLLILTNRWLHLVLGPSQVQSFSYSAWQYADQECVKI